MQKLPQVQTVLNRINKYIENIADDYFLLGLHLISLHALLRESELTTEQIKSWYAENINMATLNVQNLQRPGQREDVEEATMATTQPPS